MKKIILSGALIIELFSFNVFADYSQMIDKAKTVLRNLTTKSNEANANLSNQSNYLQGSMDTLHKGITNTTKDVSKTIQDLLSNTGKSVDTQKGTNRLAADKQAKQIIVKQRLEKEKKAQQILAQAKAKNLARKVKK